MALPELAGCAASLQLSRRGALFSTATAELAGPVLAELVEAQGVRRIALFMALIVF